MIDSRHLKINLGYFSKRSGLYQGCYGCVFFISADADADLKTLTSADADLYK